MEVNLSPSLATDAPLDAQIKMQLIVDTLNLVGIKKPNYSRSEVFKAQSVYMNKGNRGSKTRRQ